jgi:multidrug efflux pump subunit AcrB
MSEPTSIPSGPVAAMVSKFLSGPFAPILLIGALLLGAGAVSMTPREEEPQILVPFADIHVQLPGASVKEVEKLVATPLERLFWQIDGVENVYSTSYRGATVVSVSFYVGEDRERSLVKIYNKLDSNQDLLPAGVTGYQVKPIEIDDVSIVNLTLHSPTADDYTLRRIAEETRARLDQVENLSKTSVVGGRRRQILVHLDPERLQAVRLDPLQVRRAIAGDNARVTAGAFPQNNKWLTVTAGPFLSSVEEVRRVVVGVHNRRPIYLEDVAEVKDGPEEPTAYVRLGYGPAGRPEGDSGETRQAVTLAFAKKKGTNAVAVADEILAAFADLRDAVIPDGVDVTVTRNTGKTADRKVDELLKALLVAMISVAILLTMALGWREALVVVIAVPLAFSLALFINYLMGYTINRVTLFALILSLGIVVDDPITNIDNIQRHLRRNPGHPFTATLNAVREVFPPVFMSTLAIIASFLPLFFVTGMMGPYLEPMAVNVPITVTVSTLAALTIVPWLACALFRRSNREGEELQGQTDDESSAPELVRRICAAFMEPLMRHRSLRWGLIGLVVALLAVAATLALTGSVPLKLLPYADKDEFQLVLDMPEGTTLEATDRAMRDLEDVIRTIPEVTNFESYVGTASPIDFNGMIRQYYLRSRPHQADMRINMLLSDDRDMQSHGITLRVRDRLQAVADRHGGNLKIVEMPPGPPVLATVTVEVFGDPNQSYEQIEQAATLVRQRMAEVPGLVDIDDSMEAPRERWDFVLDREKAALHGIRNESVVDVLQLAVDGDVAGTIHIEGERNPLEVIVRFPLGKRAGVRALERISLVGDDGRVLQLVEIGHWVKRPVNSPIHHKNMNQVVYVYAETAGIPPAEAILALQESFEENPPPAGTHLEWTGEGEWEITVDVFRDLGIAFGVALLAIYVLLIIETTSLLLPVVIMLAIPLTAIGIIPGFFLLNVVASGQVGSYGDPIFFTATAMIGMIALGGIVVRNALVLVSFINEAIAKGMPLNEAIVECDAVRFRPIVLTATTTALGAWPITLDPIFSGLAWSLIFGLVASTLFTLIVVPTVYYMILKGQAVKAEK